MGESTDLGNTFWQAHLAKNKKTYLGRGLVKPSTEVLTPRPGFYKALDRGFFQPSVEVFINPRSRYYNLDRGMDLGLGTYLHRDASVKKIINRGRGPLL